MEQWSKAPRLTPWWYAQPVRDEKSGLKDGDAVYEAILPLVDQEQLKRSAVDSYELAIGDGLKPTALAFSVVDVRYPSGRGFDWRLIHFLLDGHHKLMAASELNRPITLLSFLNKDESFASNAWIEPIKLRYGA